MQTTIKSFLILIILLSLFNGCSRKTDKELWDEAVNLQKSEKFSEAVKLYSQIAEDYPESKIAAKALLEAAKIYESRLDKSLSFQQSLLKAVEFHQKNHDKYPKTKEGAQSLFMVAFIQANELQNLESAKSNYQKFLNEYPDHEMAASAKAEIDNLGISPDQFINQKVQAQK